MNNMPDVRVADARIADAPAQGASVPMREVDALIVGAGPAGLACAAGLHERGVTDVVVLDREPQAGGLPAQCEHRGFGIWSFKRLLRGRDFAARVVQRAERARVNIQLNTTVLSVSAAREVLAVSPAGLTRYRARALVLATGCREMARSTLTVAGSRPAGIFNTGTVQRLHTFLHSTPGRSAVVVGSDDMSLMTAQSLAGMGVRVRAVLEERPYRLGYMGLEWLTVRPRRIPFLLHHRLLEIQGRDRVTGVLVTALDERGAPRDKPFLLECDTVIFSGEFVPENTLARQAQLVLDPHTRGPRVDQDFQTDTPGVFACGNLIHAADAADHALEDGERAARGVLQFLDSHIQEADGVQPILIGAGVQTVIPQCLRWYDSQRAPVRLAVRVNHAMLGVRLRAEAGADGWGSGFTFAAKPHRSVYLNLAPMGVTLAPLTVSAQGRALVPEQFRETEWRVRSIH